MKHFYIPFDLSADINYNYLISLYDIAEYNIADNCYNTIHYNTKKSLAEFINVSNKTLTKILSDKEYNSFLIHNNTDKVIILNNNFNKSQGKNKPFVMLKNYEVNILKQYGDNMFYKYYIYMKYFCGINNNKQDFTAKQFLEYCGYSSNSNNYISRIAEYNKILTDNNLIKINKYRDELGHIRNIYSIL